jgi:hypothetical protein
MLPSLEIRNARLQTGESYVQPTRERPSQFNALPSNLRLHRSSNKENSFLESSAVLLDSHSGFRRNDPCGEKSLEGLLR